METRARPLISARGVILRYAGAAGFLRKPSRMPAVSRQSASWRRSWQAPRSSNAKRHGHGVKPDRAGRFFWRRRPGERCVSSIRSRPESASGIRNPWLVTIQNVLHHIIAVRRRPLIRSR